MSRPPPIIATSSIGSLDDDKKDSPSPGGPRVASNLSEKKVPSVTMVVAPPQLKAGQDGSPRANRASSVDDGYSTVAKPSMMGVSWMLLLVTVASVACVALFPALRSLDEQQPEHSSQVDLFVKGPTRAAVSSLNRAANTAANNIVVAARASRTGSTLLSAYIDMYVAVALGQEFGFTTQSWLSFYEGTGVFVGRTVPCDKSIPRTPNVSVVWVTKLSVNHTFVAQQYLMAGINTSAIDGTQIGPLTTTFNATDTDWYRYLVLSIYAHWWVPAVDTFGENTSFFVGAQGGVDPNAYFCTYAAEVSAQAITDLLAAIPMSPQGRMMLFHPSNDALIGTNFQWESVVRLANGTLRPRTFRELGGYSPLLEDVVTRYGDALKSCSSPCSLDYGSQFDKVFVTVVVVDHSNIRLVVAVPANDVFAVALARQRFALVTAIPVVCAIFIFGCLVTYFLFRPLRLLDALFSQPGIFSSSSAMYESFQFTLSEPAALEDVFFSLFDELRKVKSFLPSAVKRELDGNEFDTASDEGSIESSLTMTNSVVSLEATTPTGGERNLSVTSLGSKGRRSSLLGSPDARHGYSRRRQFQSGASLKQDVMPSARRVVVTAININNFHGHIKHAGLASTVAFHRKVVNSIEEAAGRAKGVLESFSGDHFLVSFNASLNCAAHFTLAAAFVVDVTSHKLFSLIDEGDQSLMLQLSIGVASGSAFCGPWGSERTKSFSIVGASMTQAYALMRRCRKIGEFNNLVNFECAQGMKYEYVLMASDVVRYSDEGSAEVVYAVVEKKKTDADEWMYELQESEGKVSADKMMEECMAAYMEGDQVLLTARIAHCEQKYPALPQLVRLKEHSAVPLLQYATVV